MTEEEKPIALNLREFEQLLKEGKVDYEDGMKYLEVVRENLKYLEELKRVDPEEFAGVIEFSKKVKVVYE